MTIGSRPIRLGFHYHIPAEQRGDGLWMQSPQGCFLDGLARQADEVICFAHSPRPSSRDLLDYRISAGNVRLVDIGPHCEVWRRTLLASRYAVRLDEWRRKLDILLVRGPSPLLPSFVARSRRLGVPTSLLLVGSYVEGVDDLPQPRWRMEIIRMYGYLYQWRQTVAARESLTFVNSNKLYEELYGDVRCLVETRTTTLTDDAFFDRHDTCLGRPVRLLYTGRFDRGKGLLEMVRAVALLVERGHDVTLDLVGWPEPGDNVIYESLDLAARLGIAERVRNHGREVLGPRLFAHYRNADIYVIASKLAEGFPRTIWEAMANSLPVVATKVGSIPQFIGDAAELIEPRSVESIVAGIERLLSNPKLRQKLIRRGMTLARENTTERRSREMIAAMREYLAADNTQRIS